MTLDPRFPAIEAPRTEERPVQDARHGVTRTDEFAWLRADNWQEVFKDPSALDTAIRAANATLGPNQRIAGWRLPEAPQGARKPLQMLTKPRFINKAA